MEKLRISNRLFLLVTLIIHGIFFTSFAQVQTPWLPGWYSQDPLDMSKSACFNRAVSALNATSLTDLKTLDGWTASATNNYLRAQVSCVEVPGGTLVSVSVAGATAYGSQANQMRDFLRDYMLNGSSGVSVSTGTPATGRKLKLNKNSYEGGEKILVSYMNLPGNSNDWITITEADNPMNKYGEWYYTKGSKSGNLEFKGLNPGSYEVRLFYKGGYQLEEKLDFTVTDRQGGEYIIKTTKSVFSAGEPILVQFYNSKGADNDWVALCKAGSSDRNYGEWFYKKTPISGEMTFKSVPVGNYEIRYYQKGGYGVQKRLSIRVQ